MFPRGTEEFEMTFFIHGWQDRDLMRSAIVSDGIPCVATGIDDGVLILEDAEAQEAFSEVEPEPFDWVEFRAVGRQQDEGDIVRGFQGMSAMPAGLIEHHDGMLVFGQGLGELGEEDRHGRRVGPGQDKAECIAGLGCDGTEDVGPFEPLVATSRRALSLLPPAMTKPPLLSHTCFVLEP